jgi:hypothetical protein
MKMEFITLCGCRQTKESPNSTLGGPLHPPQWWRLPLLGKGEEARDLGDPKLTDIDTQGVRTFELISTDSTTWTYREVKTGG